jgi:hypothetical protein
VGIGRKMLVAVAVAGLFPLVTAAQPADAAGATCDTGVLTPSLVQTAPHVVIIKTFATGFCSQRVEYIDLFVFVSDHFGGSSGSNTVSGINTDSISGNAQSGCAPDDAWRGRSLANWGGVSGSGSSPLRSSSGTLAVTGASCDYPEPSTDKIPNEVCQVGGGICGRRSTE